MALPFLLLVFANLLWGLLPYPVAHLTREWSATSLVSLRFLAGGVVFTLLALLATRGLPFTAMKPIPWRLVARDLATRHGGFLNLPRWARYATTGAIGFALQILLFFFAVKELGAVVSSLGFIVALGTVALLGWMTGRERLSLLKGLYLAVLFGASALLAWWAPRTGSLALGPGGLLLSVAYGLSLAFFLMTSDDGAQAPGDEEAAHPRWPWARLLWKLALLFLSAFGALTAAMAVCTLFPTLDAWAQSTRSFREMTRWGELLFLPSTQLLLLGCTLAPFLLYYFLAVNWKGVSSFAMWAGVLALLEPLVSMAIGVGLLGEAYPLPWLFMVSALILLGILLKWAVEREAQVHVWLLVSAKWGTGRKPQDALRRLPMVRTVKALAGPHDYFVEVVAPSQPQFEELVRVTLRALPGMERIEVLYPENRAPGGPLG